MILGSHNSLTYLPVRKWWMRPIKFTAKCQRLSIKDQYAMGVRCFDFRIRFNKCDLVVAHGLIEYKADVFYLLNFLAFLDRKGDAYVRMIHEVRTEKQRLRSSVALFVDFCEVIERDFPNIKFFCGKNLLNPPFVEYPFKNHPTIEENYASVRPPKRIDDWIPILYAELNNEDIRSKGTDKEILMIDFVDI